MALKIKKILNHFGCKCILFILALMALERLCHLATDGFTLLNVYSQVDNNEAWMREGELPAEGLDQPFIYLTSGSQSYVFLSADGKIVLKLFKFQHMRTPLLLNFLPSKGYLGKKRKKKRGVLEKTFDSFTIAYDLMQEECGLLYLHLTKTAHLKKKITLIDKIGQRYEIDLDGIEFLLQKRGTLAFTAINEWMEQGEVQVAREKVAELLHFACLRCKKGIFDKDPDFSTNFGFVEGRPFQIDCGRFSLDEKEKGEEVYCDEMVRITRRFEEWIATNHPLLLDTFQKELDAITAT